MEGNWLPKKSELAPELGVCDCEREEWVGGAKGESSWPGADGFLDCGADSCDSAERVPDWDEFWRGMDAE